MAEKTPKPEITKSAGALIGSEEISEVVEKHAEGLVVETRSEKKPMTEVPAGPGEPVKQVQQLHKTSAVIPIDSSKKEISPLPPLTDSSDETGKLAEMETLVSMPENED